MSTKPGSWRQRKRQFSILDLNNNAIQGVVHKGCTFILHVILKNLTERVILMYLSKFKKKFIKLIQAFILIGSMFFFFPAYSLATSGGAEQTNISTFVFSPLLFSTYSMSTSFQSFNPDTSIERTYYFSSEIEFLTTNPIKGDLYFGFVSPNNKDIFTWVNNGIETSLKKGLFPIVKGLELEGNTALIPFDNTTFSLSRQVGGDIKYVVTGQEPTGMYLVFSLLVSSDADPSQNINWLGIDMRPLFVK